MRQMQVLLIPLVALGVVCALAHQPLQAAPKLDLIGNYHEFSVNSPRARNVPDAEAFVRAMLHGRMVAYAQVQQEIGGVAVKGVGTADSRSIRDFGTFGIGHADLPLPGIVLKDIQEVTLRDGRTTLYKLIYHTPLTGRGSVLNSVWDKLREDAVANPPEQYELPEPTAGTSAATPAIRHTGLAVFLGGLQPALSPVVRVLADDGTEVYGVLNASTDFVKTNGMVGFARSLTEPASIQDRVGANPLRVKAIRMQSGNPVVTSSDAEAIVRADEATGFLGECRVALILGNP